MSSEEIIKFFKTFLISPATVGAIAPSSSKLANLITDAADLAHASVILEFGTGTGVFTKKILAKKPKNAFFMGFELNKQMAQITRTRCPEALVQIDSAAHAGKYLQEVGIEKCDCIISGIPWANLPIQIQQDILEEALRILKPGGKFLTFAYLATPTPAAKRFRKALHQNFSTVEKSPVVWKNIPPAFVYICQK